MPDQPRQEKPASAARLAGLWYLLNAGAAFNILYVNKITVSANHAANAANLIASEATVRLAIAAGLIGYAAYIVVGGLLYEEFKPAGRALSFIAAAFCVSGSVCGEDRRTRHDDGDGRALSCSLAARLRC